MSAGSAQETLSWLEARLSRIEFYLSDRAPSPSCQTGDSSTVAGRLTKLEDRLAQLCSHNKPVADLLRLYQQLPEAFQESSRNGGDSAPAATLEKLPTILSNDTLYTSVASDLTALHGQEFSDLETLAALIAIQPRVRQAQDVQEAQTQDVQELRARSAALVAGWYEDSLLRDGSQWVDWEERMSKQEQAVRRKEKARKRDQLPS